MARAVHHIRFAAALTLALLSTASLPAAAQDARPLPPCTLTEPAWRTDPVLIAGRHHADAGRPVGPLVCRTVDQSSFPIAGGTLRIARAKVFETRGSDELEQNVVLFEVSRQTAAGTTVLGRFFERYDAHRDQPTFHTLVYDRDEGTVIELGPRVPVAYLVAGDAARRIDAHAWVAAAAAAVGPGWVPGAPGRVSILDMRGAMTFFRDGADDPTRAASAFDPGRSVEVSLVLEGDRLAAREVRMVEPQLARSSEDWEQFVQESDEAKAARARLPAGTEPCSIGAWSIDTDPSGLNMRAEPSSTARVVGKIPPPWKPANPDADVEMYRSQFRVVGYQNGWFLVRDVTAPGVAYGEPYPRSRPQAPRGEGWVSARLVGAALANGGLPEGRLHQAPSPLAATRPVQRQDSPISTGDPVQRLLACSGSWGLVEIGGQRGWWRGICANQVTNCS
ncbi:SH3 domain-containing protein [Phreatobacter oligotrophus]|jgi:hypothetical protein|uniref:SH3 domain-containing protein n=1 Tax=Phreatobacter oligotrophus TaxID=1122261 RepID=A0A2T4Z5F8_9HYPH|nr:SH3 domain-containing protein [Phreatobacter oligotrophus]PTM57133.1 hypothetical protein C8P69_104181 [Phreatobacter oligotrophus]